MADLVKRAVKETKRKIAIKLLDEGWSQKKIASFLEVNQSSISNWKKAFEKKGEEGLKSIPQSGRIPRLKETQKEELKTAIDKGAEAIGFVGNFWTQKRIKGLLKDEFSVELKPRQCGNILKGINYVLKLPQTKSYEQKPEEVEKWKTETIPEIKKKAKERNALVYFVDESTFKLFPNLVRSYFPKGIKAFIKRFLRFKGLNVISAISPEGKLVYHIRNSRFQGRHMADFLRKLRKANPRRKLIVVWDRATAHFSKEVKALLTTLDRDRLDLYLLPAHSPELNPDEQVWKHLKRETGLRNLACKSFKELKEKLVGYIKDLANNKERIKQMFKHPDCAFV
ncbi:MAG: IS630 family transposase [Chitinophagales bacterium]